MADLQIQDYFLLAGILFVLVAVLLFMVRRKKQSPAGGCCSSCSSCSVRTGCPSAKSDHH